METHTVFHAQQLTLHLPPLFDHTPRAEKCAPAIFTCLFSRRIFMCFYYIILYYSWYTYINGFEHEQFFFSIILSGPHERHMRHLFVFAHACMRDSGVRIVILPELFYLCFCCHFYWCHFLLRQFSKMRQHTQTQTHTWREVRLLYTSSVKHMQCQPRNGSLVWIGGLPSPLLSLSLPRQQMRTQIHKRPYVCDSRVCCTYVGKKALKQMPL